MRMEFFKDYYWLEQFSSLSFFIERKDNKNNSLRQTINLCP